MTVKAIRSLRVLFCLIATLAIAQANEGSLRLAITDVTGHAITAPVHITSQANQYAKILSPTADGILDISHLPYGIYRIDIHQPGFAAVSLPVEIRSTAAKHLAIHLNLAPLTESITVRTPDTLLTIDEPGSVEMLGAPAIHDRIGSLPGRSLQDLVNSQPGWLYEGSAVLHPRGSEYQTQFVIDGIPLTDNRSPGFGPEIEADNVESLSIYTAGIPAEYGRKLGGVVEINTIQDNQPGLHGQLVFNGGSFGSASAAAQAQYSIRKDSFGASANGGHTNRYLNPVVPQNFTNTGTLGDFALRYERTQSLRDKFAISLRRDFSRFEIPNENIQQAAGQRQNASDAETMGIASYQHVISDRAVAEARAMLRDRTNTLNSNEISTPIALFQNNSFRESYFKVTATLDRGAHEWKAGVDSDNIFLREAFRYSITDPSQFDPATPVSFTFNGNRPDLEQSAFVQDTIHFRRSTIAAGLRWDHYQLLVNRAALEPRLAISHYLASRGLLFHASYDRVFQTPTSDNILLSSSTQIESLNHDNFLRLPVEPSSGDYYEFGVSKDIAHQLRIDTNYFRRFFTNFADDDQLQNTTVAFPISFRKAIIYGLEGKLEIPLWHGLNAFASYSYQVGNVWFPVTGGLFLGSDASAAATQLSGHFPNTQDQRNTFRGRLRYQAAPRLWFAAGAEYDSGLPFEFDGDPATVLAQYGPSVLSRLNFDRGRIFPSLLLNASVGATIHHSERFTTTIQADGENLSDTLDILDFAGLFSGNAIGSPRTFSLRLSTSF